MTTLGLPKTPINKTFSPKSSKSAKTRLEKTFQGLKTIKEKPSGSGPWAPNGPKPLLKKPLSLKENLYQIH